MWKDWLCEETFGEFYRFFCEEAVRLWREGGEKEGGGSWIGEETVARCCLERVREIPVRTLIYEMQSLKGENRLMGEDSGEQYADYCRRWLGEPAYLEGLRRRYPEMERLLELRVWQTVSFLREIARSLWREQTEIRERFCANREWKGVETLQTGMSDSHREGRTAVRGNGRGAGGGTYPALGTANRAFTGSGPRHSGGDVPGSDSSSGEAEYRTAASGAAP